MFSNFHQHYPSSDIQMFWPLCSLHKSVMFMSMSIRWATCYCYVWSMTALTK